MINLKNEDSGSKNSDILLTKYIATNLNLTNNYNFKMHFKISSIEVTTNWYFDTFNETCVTDVNIFVTEISNHYSLLLNGNISIPFKGIKSTDK